MARLGQVTGDVKGNLKFLGQCTFTQGLVGVANGGETYYVDSSRSASGKGDRWGAAFITIAEAVAAALAAGGHHDTILVAGTENEESSGTLTSDYSEDVTIAASQVGLRIIGMGNSPEGIAWTPAAAEGICLLVYARDCYVSGFRFRPNGATTSCGIYIETAADMAENAMGFTVENCIFRSTTTTALAGIAINGTNDVTIRGCKFTSVLTGILSISPGHSVQYRTQILDCTFDDKCTNGIKVDMRSGLIRGCVFSPGMTMALQTDLFSVGKENSIFQCHIAATAYETNCSGYSTDIWVGSVCSDVGNTDVSADGWIIQYPNQS